MRLTRRTVLTTAATAAGGLPLMDAALAGSPQTDTAAAPLRPGAPVLVVRDLDLVSRYYAEAIGFDVIDRASDEVRLGAGGRLLLTLRKRADAAPEPRGFAGLFHTAFLMPNRQALGRWLPQAARAGAMFVGASDHLVSEALYLSDPEGNGIEVYADRPRSSWTWKGNEVEMDTIDLDLENLLAAGGNDQGSVPHVPAEMTVGHVHLRVGGIPEAEAFYATVLGLDVTHRMQGATFYSTGQYHHHIATNTWQSSGSPKRNGSITGLSSFELLAQDDAVFSATAEQWLAKGAVRDGERLAATDPWGNMVYLRKA